MLNKCMIGEYYNIDCMELMSRYPDKHFDLAIVDPPYGINFHYNKYIDSEENLINIIIGKHLTEIRRVCKRVLVFCNHAKIYLFPKFDWMISYSWNTTGSYGKLGICQWQPILFYGEDIKGFGSVNGIIKSDSIHISGGEGVGFRRLEKINHPCPKPLNVMRDLFLRFSIESDLIFDPYFGSGTNGVICESINRKIVASEYDELYFNEAIQRVKTHLMQGKLFQSVGGENKIETPSMFT